MSQHQKTLLALLSGTQDAGISFSELQALLIRLGFQCRIRGDHFIFTRDGVAEIVNLHPKNGKAKPYQVKQVRQLVLKYRLGGEVIEQI